jgi:pyruvate oxidase
VFGVPAKGILRLLYAIQSSKSIDFISFSNEQSAGFAASGYAKASGKVGVVLATSGPGATNLITGLMDAAWDHIPLVAIIDKVPPTSKRRRAFEQTNWTKLFESFSVSNIEPSRIDDVVPSLSDAFEIAQRRKGVVVVQIPNQFLGEKLPKPKDNRSQNASRLEAKELRISLDKVDSFVKALAEPKSTVILAGRGALGAPSQLTDFANLTGLPIISTLPAVAVLPNNIKPYLGVVGPAGTLKAAFVAGHADRVVLLGSSFEHREFFKRDIEILQIDMNRESIGMDFEVKVSIVGDMTLVLKEINKKLLSGKPITHKLPYWFEEKIESMQMMTKGVAKGREAFEFGDIFVAIFEKSKDDAIFVADTGSFLGPIGKEFLFRDKQEFFMSAHLSSAGFGLPASIGVKLANPTRQVISIVGDAGLTAVLGELATASYYKLPIHVVVINNRGMKIVDHAAKLFGYQDYATRDSMWAFAEVASQIGIHSKRVTTYRELVSALEELFGRKENAPTLMEILIREGMVYELTKPNIG